MDRSLTIPSFAKERSQESTKVPGNMAVWVLIFAELSEFALFFILFLVAKAHQPEMFHQGPANLNTTAGLLNTLILISSSFCIARAVRAIRLNNRKASLNWLGLCLLGGAAYCGIKTWEYYWNEAQGINGRLDVFYSFYYYLTFNHLLHVLVGMCTVLWATARTYYNAYSAEDYEGLEATACYWHMIDLAWIIIFPLLYVLR